ncbi:DNA polymerase III subunit gamma and tau [Curtobacterium sp. MCBD17_035]|uniref:DNA polymerase III subunit gamma and tau n=1 Tax=Curtobacterium sp. MCBD17_035 TaxID=2175673 RepID=UPI000DA8D8E2|nr:DNA polymerase III subunit gamma and tau [Curtobacterium sp. MCBD17_035]WIB66485.1 DNA polymerase III subunit gamma and tau [Curtobacterium sp. MCBD17_035]
MVTALYRRYRPENFAELIGQSQVTDPLRTALRADRVNHAYLFSGPRGCGKTTSARILARCLNCAQGPTDTPCGVCPSCVELARDGGGSLDVIEIDAASHNGVDDARDLRDRAVFAPARDRYKIFILDEAHMVTPQGFNALLKLVEEPPEHVKFIFATTEPEKVIGTIRSRTHHYPFRLVPPASMLEYVEQLCAQESVSVAPGVLPLVVRAGGGSVRDTLSLLDQLMAGSEDRTIAYDRAVALLGYTDAALLDDVVDALAVADPASAFSAVDRVVQTGQDPRRFVEDLLERLRDLIVVAATNEGAAAVLRGVSPEELETMTRQAAVFGAVGLSRAADIANRALTEMTGATSPRLHLELMVARMLVPESDDSQRGALARVERLERRVGVGDAGGQTGSAPVAVVTSSAPAAAPARTPVAPMPAAPTPASTRATAAAAPASASGTERADDDEQRAVPGAVEVVPTAGSAPSGAGSPSSTGVGAALAASPAVRAVGELGVQQVRDSWPQVVEHVQRARRSAWMVVVTAQVTAFTDDVLTLTFPSQQDVASFKQMTDPKDSVSEYLRAAILDVLGVRVKFVARGPAPAGSNLDAGRPASERQAVPERQATPERQAVPERQATPERQAVPERQPTPERQAVPERQSTPERQSAPESAPAAPTRDGARGSSEQSSAQVPASAGGSAPAAAPAPSRASAAAPAPAPTGPVTDWVVATIPASDPTADAVPDDVEPSWAAPFGVASSPDGTAPAAVAPAGRTGGAPAGAATSAPAAGAVRGPASTPAVAGGPSDVPVDDYPLDDEPYDDGAPFPDPGPSGRSAAGPVPTGGRAPSASAPRGGGTPAPARTAPSAPERPARVPVPGRYGEAVVREILGAQFIEETTLDSSGSGGF